ncbi:MAG: phosphohydrolase [Caldiserica bacterium]|nr:MAG: phosphohydrolase [Caldisericota bacterium]
MGLLTLEEIKKNKIFDTFIEMADRNFKTLGYKEHGRRHAEHTAKVTSQILSALSFSPEEVEIGKIAGYLHDIGNAFSKRFHEEQGAVFVLRNFVKMGYVDEGIRIAKIIGQHEKRDKVPQDPVLAAVIFGDKSDVSRNRVRKKDFKKFDEHDRVNYACTDTKILISNKSKEISLYLTVDTNIATAFEYFQIFLSRFKFLKMAAETLFLKFSLFINEGKIL